MLVADTLTADLTFYANGAVGSGWPDSQALRGVSEGDMTRYALSAASRCWPSSRRSATSCAR